MAQQYLLPCECGKANPVSVAQAGRTIVCTCGREQKAPTLAGLRRLEAVEDLPSKKGTASQWTATRGALFAIGSVVALIGLATGGYGSYEVRNIDLAMIDQWVQSAEASELERVDSLSPAETYDLWKHILELGPGQAGTAVQLQAQKIHDHWRTVAIAGFSAAAVGILLAASSLVGGRR